MLVNVHLNVKRIATFNLTGDLKKHMSTHIRERSFKREECSASFSQTGTIKKHMHNHTGERPIKLHYA